MKNQNLKTFNIDISKNNYKDIIIDKRILPLFKTPIILKQLNETKRNKYNIILNNQTPNFRFRLITLNEILDIFLKGIYLYNYNLNTYLNKYNNKELILQLKMDDIYKLNNRLSNYFYIINKFIPFFKIRSLIYNIRLFLPKRLLKPQPYIKFKYRFRYIAKIYKIDLLYNNKRDRKIQRRQINKLLDKGKEIITDIDNQIIQKKNLINSLKNKNNILKFINSLLPTVTNNTQNNNSYLTNNNNILLDSKKSNLNMTNNQFLVYNNKLLINKLFNISNINKTNEIKIEQTLNSIFKMKEFESKNEGISIYSNPVEILYSKDNNSTIPYNLQKKPIINQYLKSISNYNMIKKGIFISYSNIIGFNFNSQRNKIIKNIYKLLVGSFKSMYCLISKPVFVMTPDKIIIQLFYFLFIPNILKSKKFFNYGNRNKLSKQIWFKRKKRIKKQYRNLRKIKINVRIKLRKLSNVVIIKIFKDKFKKLCDILSHLFKKPVQLDLIRLHYPYNDSNILVNLLGIMINKIKLRIIFRKLFEKAVIKNLNKVTGKKKFNILPAFLSGVNIKVAGRLLTHRVVPRKTVKIIQRGAAATGKINFSDVARYTKKNKRGAFSITVSSGQNFF
uniref:Small ribosomal subunit protein uS3m n=1 Tax=Tricholoma flavovirens TaxID=80606 RepID=A0A6C0W542_9AGAR|nr:ribosomal protein S3 [Tricholoma flavovirens]QIC20270.1 ribosomal protein S3 [Tricholoma flavovirens]